MRVELFVGRELKELIWAYACGWADLMSCLTKILRPLHCSLIFQEHLASRTAEKATSTFT
jgi:hypothetical protein